MDWLADVCSANPAYNGIRLSARSPKIAGTSLEGTSLEGSPYSFEGVSIIVKNNANPFMTDPASVIHRLSAGR